MYHIITNFTLECLSQVKTCYSMKGWISIVQGETTLTEMYMTITKNTLENLLGKCQICWYMSPLYLVKELPSRPSS